MAEEEEAEEAEKFMWSLKQEKAHDDGECSIGIDKTGGEDVRTRSHMNRYCNFLFRMTKGLSSSSSSSPQPPLRWLVAELTRRRPVEDPSARATSYAEQDPLEE